jgi:Na+/H+ antiporter NhaC
MAQYQKRFLVLILLICSTCISVFAETAELNTSNSASWTSILPPLIAIGLALIFREVITSLIAGVLCGTILIAYNSDSSQPLFTAFVELPEHFKTALTDDGHMSVVLFSLFVGGIVSLISKNGGMMAIVKAISKRARDAKTGQLATYFLGVAIFFDDYANTLIVGNTMRPITDRLKISREKLAYIVDSTAAPVAAIAFVTTWIGAELGYIQNGLDSIQSFDASNGLSAYSVFISSLKYSFYPILTLLFILVLILRKRDYGPMLKAEKKARLSSEEHEDLNVGDIDKVPDKQERWYNAVIPIAVLIFGTVAAMIYTGLLDYQWSSSNGFFKNLSGVIGKADSYAALLWSSFAAIVVGVLLTVTQKIKKLTESVELVFDGIKSMIPSIGILTLAWALAAITKELNTADFISQQLLGDMDPRLLPALTFMLAAIIAFSTGTSWGTMAILYPLVLTSCWKLSLDAGLDHDTILALFSNTVACVLAGSVFGDHCSPISDTTILSSLASDCNHIQHVRTQLPYALTVGSVAILIGTLLSAYGVPVIICYAIALLLLYFAISFFGKKVEISEMNYEKR